jgi:hypothetical protein
LNIGAVFLVMNAILLLPLSLITFLSAAGVRRTEGLTN